MSEFFKTTAKLLTGAFVITVAVDRTQVFLHPGLWLLVIAGLIAAAFLVDAVRRTDMPQAIMATFGVTATAIWAALEYRGDLVFLLAVIAAIGAAYWLPTTVSPGGETPPAPNGSDDHAGGRTVVDEDGNRVGFFDQVFGDPQGAA